MRFEKDKVGMDKLIFAFCQNKYNVRGNNLHYIGPLLSNLTQLKEGRNIVMDKHRCVIQRLLPFIDYHDSIIRRGGIVGAIHNCCFEQGTYSYKCDFFLFWLYFLFLCWFCGILQTTMSGCLEMMWIFCHDCCCLWQDQRNLMRRIQTNCLMTFSICRLTRNVRRIQTFARCLLKPSSRYFINNVMKALIVMIVNKRRSEVLSINVIVKLIRDYLYDN